MAAPPLLSLLVLLTDGARGGSSSRGGCGDGPVVPRETLCSWSRTSGATAAGPETPRLPRTKPGRACAGAAASPSDSSLSQARPRDHWRRGPAPPEPEPAPPCGTAGEVRGWSREGVCAAEPGFDDGVRRPRDTAGDSVCMSSACVRERPTPAASAGESNLKCLAGASCAAAAADARPVLPGHGWGDGYGEACEGVRAAPGNCGRLRRLAERVMGTGRGVRGPAGGDDAAAAPSGGPEAASKVWLPPPRGEESSSKTRRPERGTTSCRGCTHAGGGDGAGRVNTRDGGEGTAHA